MAGASSSAGRDGNRKPGQAGPATRANGRGRRFYRLTVVGVTGLVGFGYLAAAIIGVYDPTSDTVWFGRPAGEVVSRGLVVLFGVFYLALSRGLHRLDRWAWFAGLAVGIYLTVRLLLVAFDPERTAIVQVRGLDPLGLLYMPYLALRWRDYLWREEGTRSGESVSILSRQARSAG